jgi:ketosteroid isomerase-like protein
MTVVRVLLRVVMSALMLVVVAAAIVPAQGQAPAPPPAQGQPQGPARGRGPGIQLPRQGFEATGQNPANYTPDEAAAVAVVKKWVDTTNNHDLAAHMALIDDNIVFRGDPISPLWRGARAYCGSYGFVWNPTSVIKLDELYVVGGPSETLVLIKRTDINNPAGPGRDLNGYQVSLYVLARVKNGKITEWYDAPLNKVSAGAALRGSAAPPAAAQQPARPPTPPNVPAACMSYPEGSVR